MQIAFKEKVSEYIIYTIKLKIASNWITASSHPHFTSLTKMDKMGKEIRQFNLSILKSIIYNHERLRDWTSSSTLSYVLRNL